MMLDEVSESMPFARDLAYALTQLCLSGELSSSGRWLRVPAHPYSVFATASAHGEFFSWTDRPGARTIERFADPVAAIERALRRVQGA